MFNILVVYKRIFLEFLESCDLFENKNIKNIIIRTVLKILYINYKTQSIF